MGRMAKIAALVVLLGFCAAPALGQIPAPDADDRPGVLLPDPFDDSLSMRGDAKIVGGEPARRNAWPWQVAIYRRAVKNGTPLGAGFLFWLVAVFAFSTRPTS